MLYSTWNWWPNLGTHVHITSYLPAIQLTLCLYFLVWTLSRAEKIKSWLWILCLHQWHQRLKTFTWYCIHISRCQYMSKMGRSNINTNLLRTPCWVLGRSWQQCAAWWRYSMNQCLAQSNFLSPQFSRKLITQTTACGYFRWDSDRQRERGG